MIDSSSRIPSKVVTVITDAHEGSVNGIRFNRDGSYCISCGNDRLCKLFNPHNGRCIKVYKSHSYPVLDVAITSDNNFFASGGVEKSIFIWDVTKDVPLRKMRGHLERVNCLAFNLNDEVLCSGSYDSTVRFWDMRSRSVLPLMTLDSFKDSVTSVQLCENTAIVGCVDGYVRSFDIRVGKVVSDCVFRPITTVRVSNDHKCLLVQTLDSMLRLFDRKSGESLGEFSEHLNKRFKVGACFSHNDELVISGSEDASLVMYNIITSQVVFKGTGHRGCITCLECHPTCYSLISAATDGSIRLWSPPSQD